MPGDGLETCHLARLSLLLCSTCLLCGLSQHPGLLRTEENDGDMEDALVEHRRPRAVNAVVVKDERTWLQLKRSLAFIMKYFSLKSFR